jgi:hypothetical protein
VPLRCKSCEAKGVSAERWHKDGGELAGIYWAVKGREDADG